MHPYGFYGPQSTTWKVGADAVILIGGARAVLMQLAHPLVALGVSMHSNYLSDPFGRSDRTFTLGQKLTFGTLPKAKNAAQTINKLHRHVEGSLPFDVGRYHQGTSYHARDQKLLLWVHATLVDTVLRMYPLFIGPISEEDQEQYYQESKGMVRHLGLSPTQMPGNIGDLRAYVDEMVYGNHLAATAQARQIARVVLFPPLPTVLKPLLHLNLAITTSILPEPIREIYGLEWHQSQKLLFAASAGCARQIIPKLPTTLRELPITRKLKNEASTVATNKAAISARPHPMQRK
jgi:uncharacterized protein (DUF2236 family)